MNDNHSLGEISEELKIEETDSSGNKNFSAEEDNKEGVYVEFAIPKNANSYKVLIDGIGQVTEDYFGVGNKTEDDFFYPFLEPNKEYTVRVIFQKEEKIDSQGYTVNTPDYEIGYFDITAKAGAQSKGEVFLEDFGKVQVEKNGDFKFTKKTAFHNENLLKDEWVMEIGLNEGVSWMHPDRRSKWLTQIQIPCKKLGETYNFYTYPRYWGDVTKVDFIAYRPIMYYEYGEKQYRYQWDGYALDTNCKPESELWTKIDISKDADVAKITGTWTRIDWEDDYDYDIPVHVVHNAVMTITNNKVKTTRHIIYTKLNGSAFTDEDVSKVIYYDENEYELSKDRKTLTEISSYAEADISELLDENLDLKLFDGGKILRATELWTENGEVHNSYIDYQKQ